MSLELQSFVTSMTSWYLHLMRFVRSVVVDISKYYKVINLAYDFFHLNF